RPSGILTVSKDGDRLAMDFSALFPRRCESTPDGLVDALGPEPRPSELWEVNDIYLAIYENEAAIQNMQPDFSRLERRHVAVVAVTAPGTKADFVSRYFKPSYGMLEDHVTGSAHCALIPYWAPRRGRSPGCTLDNYRSVVANSGVSWRATESSSRGTRCSPCEGSW
ncbi:MAG TPA: PhzF family phenazine biosynthesis protein, partial [Candidatus Sulfotelmatobacter sp.]